MKNPRNAILAWLPLGFTITVLCALIYLAVQQNYRLSANDPQIQMAEDAASALATTPAPAASPPQKIDIANSLATFYLFFDNKGTVTVGDGQLDGKLPQPPVGVFDTKQWSKTIVGHHLNSDPNENRITWQPKPGVRIAAVIAPYTGQQSSGFVLVGRNIREVEKRELQLELMVLVAWIAAMIGSFVLKTGGTMAMEKDKIS